jgi:zinc protease
MKRVLASSLGGLGLVMLASCGSLPGFSAKPGWELPPPPVSESAVVKQGALHREVLENGLEIVVLEDHRLPRATIGLSFRRGAGIVAPEQAGIASFTAELLERGAGPRGALEFAEYIDELGASFGASASWDETSVGVFGLSRDLDKLFEVLADAVLRPHFDPAEAERARSQRLASLERAKDDPSTLASWHTARALYEGHRYGIPISGSPETVARLDAEAARAFHARVFVPNDAIFYASGDVQASDISLRVKQAFGTWKRGEVAEVGPPPPARTPEARRIVIVDRPDLAQARISVAHEGLRRTDDDRIPASLLNMVLGGSGFSSRMMIRLRSDEGLTYGVGSGFSLRRHAGPFQVSTFTRVPEVRRALDLLLEELVRGREDPPDEEELGWARPLATGRFSMGLETSEAVLQGLVDLDIYGLPRDGLDTYRARVRAVTAEDVAHAAKLHLHPERIVIVLVGPAEALRPQVEDLGPVSVVEP